MITSGSLIFANPTICWKPRNLDLSYLGNSVRWPHQFASPFFSSKYITFPYDFKPWVFHAQLLWNDKRDPWHRTQFRTLSYRQTGGAKEAKHNRFASIVWRDTQRGLNTALLHWTLPWLFHIRVANRLTTGRTGVTWLEEWENRKDFITSTQLFLTYFCYIQSPIDEDYVVHTRFRSQSFMWAKNQKFGVDFESSGNCPAGFCWLLLH
jgi:hypothetical protein